MHRLCKYLGYVTLASLFTVSGCNQQASQKEHLASAQEYLDQRDYRKAILELKTALQTNPANGQARTLLGKTYFETGNYISARKEFEAAAESGFSSAELWLLLAQTYLALGAEKELEALNPEGLIPVTNAELEAIRALASSRSGDAIAAASLLESAHKTAPDSPLVLVAQAEIAANWPERNSDKARSYLALVLETDPQNLPALVLIGKIEQSENKLGAAEVAFSNAIAERPAHWLPRLYRAQVRVQRDDRVGAEEDLDALSLILPSHPEAHYLRGIIHLRQRSLEEAKNDFNSALQVNSNHSGALFSLAATLYQLEEDEWAISSLQQLLKLKPAHKDGRVLLASLHIRAGRFAEAEEALQPLIDFDPEVTPEIKRLYALTQLRQGKKADSIDLLEATQLEEPDSPQGQLSLATAYLRVGNTAAAMELLDDLRATDLYANTADTLMLQQYLKDGDVVSALRSANDLVARSPDDPQSYNALAMVYIYSGDNEMARKSYDEAIRVSPGNPTALINMAIISQAERKTDRSLAYINELLKHHPQHVRGLLFKAALEDNLGDLDAVRSTLERALSLHPQSLPVKLALARFFLREGKPEEILALFAEFSSATTSIPTVLEIIGRAHLKREEYHSAVLFLEKLALTQPDKWQNHMLLAFAYAGVNEPGKLKKELETIVEIAPEVLHARIALARLLLVTGERDEFQQQLSALEKQTPDNAEVLLLSATQSERNGDIDAALSKARKAFDNSPTEKNLYSLVRFYLRAGDLSSARVVQEKWISENPDNPSSYHTLAAIYAREQLIDETISTYQKALSLDPNDYLALNNLAWYLRSTDPELALKYARRAHELAPDSIDVMDTLALALLETGDYKNSEQYIQRALGERPDSPRLRYHNALIKVALGKNEAARRILEDITQQEQAFPERDAARKLLNEIEE